MFGTTTVTASLVSISASTLLTVNSPTLVTVNIAPANATLPVGVVTRLVATAIFSDASSQDLTAQATWSSSNGASVAVDDGAGSKGRLSALMPGGATITATVGANSGTATIAVSTASLQSITISLPSPHLVLGMTLSLRATGNYSDNSTADLSEWVTWSSLDPSVAPVAGASVSGESEGATSISASYGGVMASIPIDVRAAVLTTIDLLPLAPTVATHASVPMQATGHYSDGTTFDLTTLVGWTTSAPTIAAVSNVTGSRGLVTGMAQGTATIAAIYAGTGGSTTATVSP
jgi:uncharacterized protein YjdB